MKKIGVSLVFVKLAFPHHMLHSGAYSEGERKLADPTQRWESTKRVAFIAAYQG